MRQENTITCQVDNVDVYCIPMVGSDFVLIVAPGMVVSARPKLKLKNLQWPRYVEDFMVVGGYALNVLVID